MSIPHELGYPADGHHAPLSVGKVLVVPRQVLLVPRVLLDSLVVLDAFEDDLTEAVKVHEIVHLVIVELVHQGPGLGCVVNLAKYD